MKERPSSEMCSVGIEASLCQHEIRERNPYRNVRKIDKETEIHLLNFRVFFSFSSRFSFFGFLFEMQHAQYAQIVCAQGQNSYINICSFVLLLLSLPSEWNASLK